MIVMGIGEQRNIELIVPAYLLREDNIFGRNNISDNLYELKNSCSC